MGFGFFDGISAAATYAAICLAGQVVAVGDGARVVLSAYAADIVTACYAAGVVAVGDGARVVLSAYATDILGACHVAGVVAVGHDASDLSAQAADSVATFDIACLYTQVLYRSTHTEVAH